MQTPEATLEAALAMAIGERRLPNKNHHGGTENTENTEKRNFLEAALSPNSFFSVTSVPPW
jgi:hypothetical protein